MSLQDLIILNKKCDELESIVKEQKLIILKLKEELKNSMNFHCKHFKTTDSGYVACELKIDLTE